MKKFVLGLLTSTLFFSSPILALAQEEQEEMEELITKEDGRLGRVAYPFKVQFIDGDTRKPMGSPIRVYQNEDIEASLIAWIPEGYHFLDEVYKSIPVNWLNEFCGYGLAEPTFNLTIKRDPQGVGYPPLEYPYSGRFYPVVIRGKRSNGEMHVVRFENLDGAPTDGWDIYITGTMINDQFKKDGAPYRVPEDTKIPYTYSTMRTSYSHPYDPDRMRWAGLRNEGVLSIKFADEVKYADKESAQIFRLFNPSTKAYLYTNDGAEKESLLSSGQWNNEGHAWTAPHFSSNPVYRLFNPKSGEHLYTTSKDEYDTLVNCGWVGQNTAFYSAEDGENKVALYRLYNSKAPQAAQHHYTIDEEERDNLVQEGWTLEGTAWYGFLQ